MLFVLYQLIWNIAGFLFCCLCFVNKGDPKFIKSRKGKKGILIGHRIYCDDKVDENSIEALKVASKIHIDGIEFDLSFSKDDEIMIIHDQQSLDRVLQIKPNIPLSSLTCKEVKEYETLKNRSCRILTLDEIMREIKSIKQQKKNEDMILAIDIKEMHKSDLMLQRVAEFYRKNEDLYDCSFVICSHPFQVIKLKILNPRVLVVATYIRCLISYVLDNKANMILDLDKVKKKYFCNSDTLFNMVKRLSWIGDFGYEFLMQWGCGRFCDGFAFCYEELNNKEGKFDLELVNKLKDRGFLAHAWTINDRELGKKLMDKGITIYSDEVRNFL